MRQMVHASGRPMYEIATIAGFRHVAKFSSLVNASIVPDSNVNVRRLNAIADAVGLPRTEVFIDQAVR